MYVCLYGCMLPCVLLVCLFVCLFACLFACFLVCLIVCVFVCLSVCLFVCLACSVCVGVSFTCYFLLFSGLFDFFGCFFCGAHAPQPHAQMAADIWKRQSNCKQQTGLLICIYLYIPSTLSQGKNNLQPLCTQTQMHSGSLEGEPPTHRTFPPTPPMHKRHHDKVSTKLLNLFIAFVFTAGNT